VILLEKKISNYSEENNFIFLDATDFLIEKGKKKILHGPLDWRHYNYEGYETISEFLLKNISKN